MTAPPLSSSPSSLDPAPIALFCYARPEHTRRTIEALARNPLADQSELIVFQDGSRGEIDREDHLATTSIIERVRGFRSVRIVKRSGNMGLADNIIDGVSQVVSAHGRIIVVEDDLLTAPSFLTFLNAALDRYADEKRVWHVSGWSYPIRGDGLGDCYFQAVMNCWGWATWADRWAHFSREPEQAARRFDRSSRHSFNLDGAHDFHAQIRHNASGRLKSWAIFWYETIFRNDGLCLNPAQSLVLNIGHDGSGENCRGDIEQAMLPDGVTGYRFPETIEEGATAKKRISAHLRQGLSAKARNRMRRILARWQGWRSPADRP